MKIKILLFLVVIFVVSACTQQSCPTYGNNYTFTPSKRKAPRSSGRSAKPVKRAEM